MSITEKTAKLLWGNSAARCAHCKKHLYMASSDTDDASLIGDMAHIAGENPGSARYGDPLPVEKRNLYDNLLLLCKNHHKEIDDREGEYPSSVLHKLKSDHESWVKNTLEVDYKKLRDEVILCEFVDKWEELFHLSEWNNWSSWISYSGDPEIRDSIVDDLGKLNKFLLATMWPEGHEGIVGAFINLRLVLNDYLYEFRKHAEKSGDSWRTPKFYHIDEWNTEKYERLFKVYDKHVRLLENMFFEICRAANYLIFKIREELISGYRSVDGLLLCQRGGTIDDPLVDKTIRLEYTKENISDGMYVSREKFIKTGILSRSFYIPPEEE